MGKMSVSTLHHLNLKIWHHPIEDAQGSILICHGLGEHSGRYLEMVSLFHSLRLNVFRFDLRGCGESQGHRQWIEKFDDYVEDLRNAYRWARSKSPHSQPFFLFAHSLGGAISSFFLPEIQEELKAIIFSAPAYLPGQVVARPVVWAAKTIEKILPRARLKKPADTGQISKIPYEIQRFNQDPFCYRFYTLRQGNEILKALPKVKEQFQKIKKPWVIFHGSHDTIIRVEGSFELLQISPAQDKNLIVLPTGVHESHHDTVKKTYFQEVRLWVQRQLQD